MRSLAGTFLSLSRIASDSCACCLAPSSSIPLFGQALSPSNPRSLNSSPLPLGCRRREQIHGAAESIRRSRAPVLTSCCIEHLRERRASPGAAGPPRRDVDCSSLQESDDQLSSRTGAAAHRFRRFDKHEERQWAILRRFSANMKQRNLLLLNPNQLWLICKLKALQEVDGRCSFRILHLWLTQVSPPLVDTSIETETETDTQATTTQSPHLPSGESADTYLPFECDPAKRIPISCYDAIILLRHCSHENQQEGERESQRRRGDAAQDQRLLQAPGPGTGFEQQGRERRDGGEEAQEELRRRQGPEQEEELRAVPPGAGAARLPPPHVRGLRHDVRPRERRGREGPQGLPQELLRGRPLQGLARRNRGCEVRGR